MAYTLGMITKEVTWLDSHVRKLSLNIYQQIGVTWEVQWKENLESPVILMALTSYVSSWLLTNAVVNEVLQALGNTLGASFGAVIKDFIKNCIG